MDPGELAALESKAMALQGRVDSMLEKYNQQLKDAAKARRALATSTTEGWSGNRLVRVTANSAGIPLHTWIDPDRRGQLSAEQLSAAITEAAQEAARAAKTQVGTAMESVNAAVAQLNPAELFPDMPELGKPIGDLLPPPPPPGSVPSVTAAHHSYLDDWGGGSSPVWQHNHAAAAHSNDEPAATNWMGAPQPWSADAPPTQAPQPNTPAPGPAEANDDDDEPVWKGLRNDDWW